MTQRTTKLNLQDSAVIELHLLNVRARQSCLQRVGCCGAPKVLQSETL